MPVELLTTAGDAAGSAGTAAVTGENALALSTIATLSAMMRRLLLEFPPRTSSVSASAWESSAAAFASAAPVVDLSAVVQLVLNPLRVQVRWKERCTRE